MITLKKVEVTDLDSLLQFSKSTFYEFFAHLNDPVHFEAYATAAFTPQNMLAQLTNPNSEFYFALAGDEIAGYIKLNTGETQNEFKTDNALELERIYVSGEHHGKNVGKQLLLFAIEQAINTRKDFIWLGVWEHNSKALGFYKHHGFEICGSHEFNLGGDKQTDILMKREL